ncbi:MAG: glycerate kinase [Sumerlaeia bacterium]
MLRRPRPGPSDAVPPRVLVSLSTFKGSVTGQQAGEAFSEGLRAALPHAETHIMPLADGGGGTLDALAAENETLEFRHSRVSGPLGEPVTAPWLYSAAHQTAVIEMRAAAGLDLVPLDRRNPCETTTYGVGELIGEAKKAGARHLLLGLGDSATADCGAGMLQGLGAKFSDQRGELLERPVRGGDLPRIHSVGLGPVRRFLDEFASFKVLCDVENPLLGPAGAAEFFAQKGATEEQCRRLEEGFETFVSLLEADAHATVRSRPGAGAAGGLGAACAICRGRLLPGASTVMAMIGFQKHLEWADLLVLGEGAFDSQSLGGKASGTALHRARARGVPVLLICGKVKLPEHALSGFQHVTVKALTSGGEPPPGPEETLNRIAAIGRAACLGMIA